MKPAGIIGIILIVIGMSRWLGGITYTKREKVLDLGPIQATAEKQRPFRSPGIGGICLVGESCW